MAPPPAIAAPPTGGAPVTPATHPQTGTAADAPTQHPLTTPGAADATPAATDATPPATVAAAASDGGAEGEKVYKATCTICHAAGVAGAPKTGVAADWEARLAQGIDVLKKHSIEGLRAMPPKGGNLALTNEQVNASVDYMLSRLK